MWCSVKGEDFNPLFSLFASINIRSCGAECYMLFSSSSCFNNNFHKKACLPLHGITESGYSESEIVPENLDIFKQFL